jgi:hypothetical protein
MNYRILHILDHSIPLHSGYTFRSAAILRRYSRLIRAVLMYGESLRRNANIYSARKRA